VTPELPSGKGVKYWIVKTNTVHLILFSPRAFGLILETCGCIHFHGLFFKSVCHNILSSHFAKSLAFLVNNLERLDLYNSRIRIWTRGSNYFLGTWFGRIKVGLTVE
jgi:hypothetical protein